MMFCLQKFLLVLLFKSLLISCVVTNLRLSTLDIINKVKNISEKNKELQTEKIENKSTENKTSKQIKNKDSVSLLEKKSEIKQIPVNKFK